MPGEQEKRDWLRLIRTQSIGPITFQRLIEKFGSAGEAILALPEFSKQSGRKKPLTLAPIDLIEKEIEAADRAGAQLIAQFEPDYPVPLRDIPDAPPVIYVRGNPSLFDKPAIAIIGARNASGIGRKIARALSTDLGDAGFSIVSGLARGIDGAAHEAALRNGTIAVVAGGVDHIYPPEHEALMDEIGRSGVVLSEQPIGYPPTARDFPKRNRLISGLSRGVIVVEAAKKSGTLITARFALEQGREVFAVPGSPLDPRCEGANRLIADGATLTQNANDVVDQLRQSLRSISERDTDSDWRAATAALNSEFEESALRATLREQVISLLSYTPIHRDEILRETNLPAGPVADALLDLVLSEDAIEHPGGAFSLHSAD